MVRRTTCTPQAASPGDEVVIVKGSQRPPNDGHRGLVGVGLRGVDGVQALAVEALRAGPLVALRRAGGGEQQLAPCAAARARPSPCAHEQRASTPWCSQWQQSGWRTPGRPCAAQPGPAVHDAPNKRVVVGACCARWPLRTHAAGGCMHDDCTQQGTACTHRLNGPEVVCNFVKRGRRCSGMARVPRGRAGLIAHVGESRGED